ncbi:hypothetical protein [Flavobacterium magnum]|uniref:hypothetical protein n=1 Tax=Flavobacterium magnum TaxID=2162713 RepID=UPI0011B1F9D7|nr:hypothetical protein [Flavobacterium magnum]
MRNFLISFCFFTLISCGIGDSLKKRDEIEADLQKRFNTQDIGVTVSWGTETEQNYVNVDFTNYNLNSRNHNYLDSLSKTVFKRIREKFPEIRNRKKIVVRFTAEQNADSAKSVISFQN